MRRYLVLIDEPKRGKQIFSYVDDLGYFLQGEKFKETLFKLYPKCELIVLDFEKELIYKQNFKVKFLTKEDYEKSLCGIKPPINFYKDYDNKCLEITTDNFIKNINSRGYFEPLDKASLLNI